MSVEPTQWELIKKEAEEKFPCLKTKSSWNKGKHFSAESKGKMRQAKLGKLLSEAHKASLKKNNSRPNDMRGKYSKSEEQRRKISQSLTGIVHSEESNIKRSITEKGREPWNKGKHLSEEDKLHKSLAQKGKPHSFEHTKAAMLAQNIEPNKVESELMSLLDAMCPGEYDYVGDGSIIMFGASPDFINANGQKKVIELFGDY